GGGATGAGREDRERVPRLRLPEVARGPPHRGGAERERGDAARIRAAMDVRGRGPPRLGHAPGEVGLDRPGRGPSPRRVARAQAGLVLALKTARGVAPVDGGELEEGARRADGAVG